MCSGFTLAHIGNIDCAVPLAGACILNEIGIVCRLQVPRDREPPERLGDRTVYPRGVGEGMGYHRIDTVSAALGAELDIRLRRGVR